MPLHILLLFFGGLGTQTVLANNYDYAKRALDTMISISQRFQIDNCFQNAREFASNLSFTDGPKHFAVAWINMYTSECTIDEELLKQDKSNNKFYSRLNKELRCAFHKGRDKDVKEAFQQAGSIINEALRIMKPCAYQNIFRGFHEDFPYRSNLYFVEEGFFSTSTNINIALVFANGNTLMIVENIIGLDIASYSIFQKESEVLSPMNSTFKITRTLNDPKDINKVMSQLHANPKRQMPSEILYVTQVPTNKNSRENRVLKGQQFLSLSYCDPK